MSKGFSGALMRHLGAHEHETTVIAATMTAPTMRRLRFRAPTAFEDIRITPTTYVRGWFPDEAGKESQRGYTLIDIDAEAGEYSIDFLLHEPAGPASAWARTAQVGDTLTVTPFGVRPFTVPEPTPFGCLIIADAAGIPCVNDLVEAYPAEMELEIVLGIHDPREAEIPILERPGVRIHRVSEAGPQALAQAIPARSYQDWTAYLVCESGRRRAAITRLTEEFGFPKSEIGGQAYWKQGRTMGTSRETPAEGAIEDSGASEGSGAPESTSADESTSTAPTPTAPCSTTWTRHRGGELLRPLRPLLIGAGIAQAIATVLQLVPLVLLVELCRRMLAGAGRAELLSTLLAFAAVLAAGALLEVGLVLVLHLADARFARDVRLRLLDRLAVIPLGWFTDSARSRAKHVIQDDTLALHALTTHAVLDAVGAVTAPLLVLGYLAWVDWRITLVLLLPIIFYALCMYTMVFRSFDAAVDAPRRAAALESEADALVSAQPIVAIHPRAGRFYAEHLAEYLSFLRTWQIPFTRIKAVMNAATRPSTLLLVILLAATPLVLTGLAAPTAVLPFILLGTTFATRLLAIGYQLQGLATGRAAANRIGEILTRAPLSEPERSADLPADAGITLEHVSYAYRAGAPVLQDVSLRIPAGSTCAIVGPSGAGKSTLAHLLARFDDPAAGRILLGGRDLRSLSTQDLYARIGFVFQDLEILRGTVAENIALARPEASAAQIAAAAEAVGIDARIRTLPAGYATELDGPVGLSGGELQLIVLARLLLADPPVLILDEATASADPLVQSRVHRALERLMADRTVVTIAHRLSTVTGADQVIVLEDGRVVQSGTHADLLAEPGRYRALWEARR